MPEWVTVLFSWPTGGFWSNAADDVIVGVLLTYFGSRTIKRIHAKLDRHHAERLQQAQDHHEALKQHITDTANPEPKEWQ